MDIEAFWKIIEQSKRGVEDCDEQSEQLAAALVKLSPEEIASFDQHFQMRRIEAYTWNLWGVAYLINGGCSDDGFDYFRGWLIAQGRKRFEAALKDAETVVPYAEPDECECEDILSVAAQAYEERTGGPLPDDGIRLPQEPLGSRWEEEDLEQLFPIAAKKFAN
jgi:hypothetical protein